MSSSYASEIDWLGSDLIENYRVNYSESFLMTNQYNSILASSSILTLVVGHEVR